MGFLRRIFGRNKPPPVPDLPRQAPAPELMDFIDEITGVQTITVTDSQTGKKRRVTKRLPPTPQEKEILDRAQGLIAKAVSNIETLYKYDPTSVVDYQPFIRAFSEINNERASALQDIGNFKDIAEKVKQFQAMNTEIFNREFDTRERLTEEMLAKKGLGRSTIAAEQRALNARERALGAQQADVTAYNYGEDLANRQLQRETNLFNLQEADRNARLQEAETGYNLERQKQQELENTREKAIAENMNLLGVGQNIQGEERQKSLLGQAGGQAALNTFTAQANNQNARYNQEIARIQGNYNNQLARFNATPPSFGQKLTDLALKTGGDVAGGYISSQLPSFGSNINNSNAGAKPSPTQLLSMVG